MMLKDVLRTLVPPVLLGKIRHRRLKRALAAYPKKQAAYQIGEFTFTLSIEDGLAEAWYAHDAGELPEITLLRNYKLRPGAKIFDLGAHQGVVALSLAAIVGDQGRVLAVEANSHNAAVAKKNAELNSLPQIHVLQAAASDKVGRLSFNEGLNGNVDDGTGSWGRTEVDAVTVDSLAAQFGTPDLVFIDIEGFECFALAGASRALESGVDFFIEVHVQCGLERFGGSVQQLSSFFPLDRYDLQMLSDDAPEARPFDARDQMTKSRFYLVATSCS